MTMASKSANNIASCDKSSAICLLLCRDHKHLKVAIAYIFITATMTFIVNLANGRHKLSMELFIK